jgi:hypothetical protein
MASSGADILARLTKKVNQNQKDSICVFSAPGCGKTSLAGEFPGACFVTDGRDHGYATLVRNGLIQSQFEPMEAADWDSLVQVTKAIANPATPVDFETVVFENLGGFQLHLIDKLITEEISRTGKDRQFVTDKFMAWNTQGLKAAIGPFSDWFKTACSITERTNSAGKGMRVIFNGHATLVKDKNIAGNPGEEFYRVDISLHPLLQEVVHRDCDNIGWIRQRPLVIKSDNGGAGRALADDIRELVFVASGNATAKNRWGLTEAIPMGTSSKHAYANLVNAIVAAKKRTAQPTGESK